MGTTYSQFMHGLKIAGIELDRKMLADMAVDIMASKSLLYRVAWEADREVNANLVHARASAVTFAASFVQDGLFVGHLCCSSELIELRAG